MKALAFFISALLLFSCVDHSLSPTGCFTGHVIGKIRSAGGGIAVSLVRSDFGTHEWQGYPNVVEALNIPHDLTPGDTIYLRARPATASEKNFPVTADGNESDKPVIWVEAYSEVDCPSVSD
jgi:hypothetical protein